MGGKVYKVHLRSMSKRCGLSPSEAHEDIEGPYGKDYRHALDMQLYV